MLLLEAVDIKKYYGDRLIMEFPELKVYSGDRIGIVGLNGSGKTTLLNILAKEIEPDSGFVRHYCDIAFIRQFSEEGIEADERTLSELELSGKTSQQAYSGGERTRIRIANAFSAEKPLLFADEPTSNLDYRGIEVLTEKLSKVESFLLISHDRSLLDMLCNKVIEVREGRLRIYDGNYTFYKEQSEAERRRAEREYEQYLSEKERLTAAIREREGKSRSIMKAPRRMGNSEARLHKRSATEKQEKINNAAKSLRSRLKRLEAKEKPEDIPEIRIDFSLTDPPENRVVISAENLSFSYGDKVIFEDASFKIYNGSKTALWGENGSGKTTLLNIIANIGLGRDIFVAPKAKIGYFCQGFENLDYDRTVLENLMEESIQSQSVARTILARLLIAGDDVRKKVGVLSGGERIKLSFAKLLVSDANVLLLDEPTNYLDIGSMEALEKLLKEYEGTVIFVSHDSAFVNNVANRLLIIKERKIEEFDGNLDEYKRSLEKRDKVDEELKRLDRLAIEMRMAEVVAKLSQPGADKESLEEEYQSLVKLLRQ